MTERAISFTPHRVAILLTDMEGSTRLWQEHAAVMPLVLIQHHRTVQETVEAWGGRLPPDQGEGDARFGVFTGDGAEDAAVRAALDLQSRLSQLSLPSDITLKVRMAVDVGDVVEFQGNVFGNAVNRCARLRGMGHGGQVLVSDAVAARCRGGVNLLDLGQHTLRDVIEPVRVFQADLTELHPQFPPLTGVLPAPIELPEVFGQIVGREEELARLTGLVVERPFVTLTGPGGTGKTRLAIQVAREVADQFPGGVYFVDLVPVAAASDVGRVVASVMGVSDDDAWVGVASAAKSRRPLLVLDNCEELTDLATALTGAGAVALERIGVLATSRRPIGALNELVVPVPPLPAPVDDPGSRAELEATPAGQLLLTRALEARPSLVVDEETAAQLGTLARRLDGIPLALELAAARLRLQSVPSLLASLEGSLDALTSLSVREHDRQRRLSDVLDWSISHLDDPAQALLGALATFIGSPDIAAIASVSQRSESAVVDPLSRLLDASLVRAVELADGSPRFRLLVPVRERVCAGLPPELAEEFAEQHADYHRRWARAGSQQRYNTPRDREWYLEAQAVRGDAILALDHLMVSDPALAIEYAVHLGVLWYDLGEGERCVSVMDELVAKTDDAADPYRTAARLYRWALLRDSEVEIDEIVARAVEIDEAGLAAVALWGQALWRRAMGQRLGTAESVRAGRQWAARQIARERAGASPLDGLTRGEVAAEMLETLDASELRWRDAREAAELALAQFERALRANTPGVRSTGIAAAEALAECGDIDAAAAVLTQLQAIRFAANASHHLALAMLQLRRGDLNEALASLDEERAVTPAVGIVARCMGLAADVQLLLDRPRQALRELDALPELPPTRARACPEALLARTYVELGLIDEARAVLDGMVGHVNDEDAWPGTLTYYITRALTTSSPEREQWIRRFDDCIATTGVMPWPREARDRERLSGSGSV
jgi:predicted ATPase/class 3 adenylate cyclase